MPVKRGKRPSQLYSPSVRLVTYARAGVGDSDALADSKPRSFGAAADELRRLLEAADVTGPYVLVGHSIGALIAQI
jgi:pimeloyl-ACP methyl ester carboxylesterase